MRRVSATALAERRRSGGRTRDRLQTQKQLPVDELLDADLVLLALEVLLLPLDLAGHLELLERPLGLQPIEGVGQSLLGGGGPTQAPTRAPTEAAPQADAEYERHHVSHVMVGQPPPDASRAETGVPRHPASRLAQ